ncbi:hypothetical protein [Phytomonospora endophytica]|uniref:Uncharacterized protein n=1 Tax=Phytomonospora endophytica TaxID=714109 RepID=A0A841FQP1_9ACTN|nr:hypothetical protein [Phytomonospora endophytica]MBB6039611.1 hypothetical protein [Phytomonospora endophytica]GIG65671.1 hypothetical protein Pen01_19660 [Phytomonospora endophytica]
MRPFGLRPALLGSRTLIACRAAARVEEDDGNTGDPSLSRIFGDLRDEKLASRLVGPLASPPPTCRR